MSYVFFYETEIGKIAIKEKRNNITNIYFDLENIDGNIVFEETKLIKETGLQIKNYLLGRCKSFDIPIYFHGTEFMEKVWAAVYDIPYGKTCSYKDIAENIGHSKAYRAVGLANNRNPIPIIIPCHRVIGNDGKMVGYGGGIEIKKRLLEIEKKYS